MSLIASTASKVLAILLAVAVVVSIALGGWVWYRGTVIASQEQTIASQALTIKNFEKDQQAQAKADKQLKDKLAAIQKERETFEDKLKDALKGNSCNDTPIPDDAKRLLEELYSSQHPR